MEGGNTALAKSRIGLSVDELSEFCRRWKIVELALFGSVLRSDFKPDSDVDMLVSFAADAQWSLLDHVRMQDEFSTEKSQICAIPVYGVASGASRNDGISGGFVWGMIALAPCGPCPARRCRL